MDVLKKENVKAIFFWQTDRLKEDIQWKRVLTEGHEIGIHTCSHPNLTQLNYEEQRKEIEKSKKTLERLMERSVKWFRPPFGLYDHNTIKIAKELNLEIILWSLTSWDWEHSENPEKIVQNVLENIRDKDIILFHELPQTFRVLERVIVLLKQRGINIEKQFD